MHRNLYRTHFILFALASVLTSCSSASSNEEKGAIGKLTKEETEIMAHAFSDATIEEANAYGEARDALNPLQQFATDMPFSGIDPADAQPFIGSDWRPQLLPLLQRPVFKEMKPNIIAVIGLVGGDDAVPVLMDMADQGDYLPLYSYVVQALGSAGAASQNAEVEAFLLARSDKEQLQRLLPTATPSQIESVYYQVSRGLAKLGTSAAISRLEAMAAADHHAVRHLEHAKDVRNAGGFWAYVRNTDKK